jgi:hypothetical protein
MVSELRPRGIGEILDSAVALYRARFPRLLRIAALVVIPVQVLSAIVLLSAQPDRFTLNVTGTASPQYDSSSFALQFAATIVVAIVGILSTALIVAVCSRIVAGAYIGESPETGGEFRVVRPRVLAILGTSLLVLVCDAIGFVFCFIGALVPLTFFAVALPVLILEGVGVSAAIGRSVTLTRSHFFHVLGLVITAQLLGAVLNAAMAVGVSFLVRAGGGTVAVVIGQSIANTIAGVLTTPFIATAIVVLYFDLRIRDEAFDVQLLMQRNDARIAV